MKRPVYIRGRRKESATPRIGGLYVMFKRAEEIDPKHFYGSEIESFKLGCGEWATGCCPFHGDNSPSFAMHMGSGGFVCYATSCGESGGDIVSFVSAMYGLSRTGALRWLEENQWM